MEETKKLYKFYEGKKVRIITQSNFSYNTSDLECFEDRVRFTDKYGNKVLLAYSEIKFITEVSNGF